MAKEELESQILAEAVESAPAAFFVVDAAGSIVTANRFAYAMLGYSRHELLALNARELALSDDIASLLLPDAQDATQSGIAPLRHANGSVLLVRYQKRCAESGSVRLAVCVAYPRRVLPGNATPQEIGARRRRSRDNRDLSDREAEILELIADGLENDEISRQLFISKETVKSHVRRLLHKLGARSRTHAVAIALRRDLID